MAPIKFEEHIKDTLEKRVITPKRAAWDKLAEQLDAQESKKSTKTYWWFGVAASIIVIVVVNQFLSKEVTPNIIEPVQIVNDEATQILNKKPSIDKKNVVTDNNKVAESDLQIETDEQHKNTSVQQHSIAEVNTTSIDKKQSVENKESQNDDSNQELKTVIPINNIENAVVQTNTQGNEIDNSQSVDNEIEALLGEAKASIASKTAESKESPKINPDGLLEEVEFDLDQSFRDKVFQKIKSSYKKVSTAVAHRND